MSERCTRFNSDRLTTASLTLRHPRHSKGLVGDHEDVAHMRRHPQAVPFPALEWARK